MKKQIIVCIKVVVMVLMTKISMAQSRKFSFGVPKKGFSTVSASEVYDKNKGYGFLANTTNFFVVDLPEGNYDVKMTFGDVKSTSETTIKVENRRLMLEKITTKTGQRVTKTFTVNIRNARINDTTSVKLKARELDYWHWDNQLMCEFTGKNPKVKSIEITRNTKAVTVFLAGNSTVVDQAREPYSAWGQMIPRFLKAQKVAVANHAESGESLRSFVAANRLSKIMSQIKPGDYLFIEFAHNDQKIKNFRPFVEYKELLKKFITAAHSKGATPVLVTSMHRRSFDTNGSIKNTLDDFPAAMRQTATEAHVTLIDLNAMSKTLWETLGTEASKQAFVHIPAGTYPNQDKAIVDDTHFSNYGAYQLAQCVAIGIKKSDLKLKKFIIDCSNYSPAIPDDIATFDFPKSPLAAPIKPDGN
jgi:lysophospholipase L1-like esterase